MQKRILVTVVIACISMLLASGSSADIPAPPVNQDIGMKDVPFDALTEDDCLECHADGVPAGTHHSTPVAQEGPIGDPNVGDCTSCHDTFVNDVGDGHLIPTYDASLVTPKPRGGSGLPLNVRGKGVGACDYCHDEGLTEEGIMADTNMILHHNTDFGTDDTKCNWCHDFSEPVELQIRACEGCHGFESLHNIQVDSEPDGQISVGSEMPGYGHIGNDDDCWGCHGFLILSVPEPGDPDPYHLTYGDQTEADCRLCHEADLVYLPDRHHLLYGQLIPAGSVVPYPDVYRSGNTDPYYICFNCHGVSVNDVVSFTVVRDCLVCHLTNPCEGLGGDTDGDGVCNANDNCPDVANADQADSDGDGIGDACDTPPDPCEGLGGDTDGDGVCNADDNCPLDMSNDADEDGVCPSDGDCDDNDGNKYPGNAEVCDGLDNDCNGETDDGDSDGDGIEDCLDNCPDEDSRGFDANDDGCIDNLSGLIGFLETLVNEGVIEAEIKNSLISKVENAEKSADKENICAAINQLESLINQVNSQRGKKISDVAANEVIAYTESVIAYFRSQLPPGDSC